MRGSLVWKGQVQTPPFPAVDAPIADHLATGSDSQISLTNEVTTEGGRLSWVPHRTNPISVFPGIKPDRGQRKRSHKAQSELLTLVTFYPDT